MLTIIVRHLAHMATSKRNFHHPFKPYEIQNQLMNAIYDCIAEGQIGIFESPTGRRAQESTMGVSSG